MWTCCHNRPTLRQGMTDGNSALHWKLHCYHGHACPHSLVQVVLRILGTALGATVGFAVMLPPSIAHSPALLLLIMVAVGLLLAPFASPSFHLRWGTRNRPRQASWARDHQPSPAGGTAMTSCCLPHHHTGRHQLDSRLELAAACNLQFDLPCNSIPADIAQLTSGCLSTWQLSCKAGKGAVYVKWTAAAPAPAAAAPAPAAAAHRLATALTLISMYVVVLCQYDVQMRMMARTAYMLTRILEVSYQHMPCYLANLVMNSCMLQQHISLLENQQGVIAVISTRIPIRCSQPSGVEPAPSNRIRPSTC